MNYYEAVCAFNPTLSEEKLDALLGKIEKRIKDHEGEFVKAEKMGLKKLAYTLRKHKNIKECHYVIINFRGTGNTVSHLRDAFKIQEEIIKYLIARAKEEIATVEESIFPAEPLKEEKIGEPK